MKIIIIDKHCSIKEVNNHNIHDLYKQCGFKKINGYIKHHTWVVTIDKNIHRVSVYGKDTGRAGMENKYELPPPVDNVLFFGKIALVHDDEDLTIDLWNKIYEKLFGGFFELDKEEELSDDELDEYPDEMKTKSGYLKDDFVVSDDDSDVNDAYYFSSEEN
tara:strand:+ start:2411 stop:2893 length:483 start_codon:yes stop_codon:yes gene_type:complete